MRRIKSRSITIAALAATTMLGACTDMYLDRRETVSFEAGNASAANKAIQTIDPWPVYAAHQNIAYDGERMQAAAERYRTGKTVPLSSASTSSVKYEPVVLAPAPK